MQTEIVVFARSHTVIYKAIQASFGADKDINTTTLSLWIEETIFFVRGN